MVYEFDGYELDADRVELRRGGLLLPVEPQVFALLLLLVANHERVVSRDEIVEKVWHGRIVSETAISSRVKSLRRVLGDDGRGQRLVRTAHGHGFRFVADVRLRATRIDEAAGAGSTVGGRPSIAVLPFRSAAGGGATGDALAHETILSLGRLGWLKVISRGSSFRFRGADPDPRSVGAALGVRYTLAGYLEFPTPAAAVLTAELADTSDGAVVWNGRFDVSAARIHDLRRPLADAVVAALDRYIPINEARVAARLPAVELDDWSRFHLGLQCMYRFNRVDNARAADLFRQVADSDPEFGRAWAGLSFTDFQSAYLHYASDTSAAVRRALDNAERSVAIDPDDAFGNFTLGRAYWLSGDVEDSRAWLRRSVELSPSYAQGHYARGWADAMAGNGEAARASIDLAMSLSPLDPFLYAMKGSRALSYIAEGTPELAVPWIDAAASTPGAHPVVGLVAAATHAMVGDLASARSLVRRSAQDAPHLTRESFSRYVPFRDAGVRADVLRALAHAGLA